MNTKSIGLSETKPIRLPETKVSKLPQSKLPQPELCKETIVTKVITVESKVGQYIYYVFHTIISLIAIYLSFRCNGTFEIGPFLLAVFFPYIYIIYILATRGTCGIIQGETIK
jgi:hypothetical protein